MWFAWTALASVTCILVGSYWDISWHMSIGRDTFWTPAHLLIQAGGILGGVSGAVQIFFGKDRSATIKVWGFRGPLGAFLAAWGAATMLVSAPFDNWWHSAYGLDVKILSPPHVVLSLGMLGVAVGGNLVVLAAMNRAPRGDALRERLRLVLLVISGEVLVMLMTAIFEHTFRTNLHTSDAYQFMAAVAPAVVIATARVADYKWAATLVTGVYTAILLAGMWVLPLFPAEPKLGPVYQPITHYIPLHFPILLIAPALVLDLVRPYVKNPLVLGPLFLAVLVAVEYPFATFLESPAARNWFWGSDYFAYFMRPDWMTVRHEFFPDPSFAFGLAIAGVVATIGALLGNWLGGAMKKVQR